MAQEDLLIQVPLSLPLALGDYLIVEYQGASGIHETQGVIGTDKTRSQRLVKGNNFLDSNA